MTPLAYYQKKIATGEILADAQQLAVMQQFEKMYQALRVEKTFLPKLALTTALGFKKKPTVRGIYLWGNVGIGKTFLIDTFYYGLPFDEKMRVHFYAFMKQLHADLRRLKGVSNPLQHIAKQWAKQARVICFDEFVVNDIADAMLLGNLFDALLNEGICLVITSNFAPDDLYPHGIQRELFLPAIARIKQSLDIIHLQIKDDYRKASFWNKSTTSYYLYPITAETQEKMEAYFSEFSNHAPVNNHPLEINSRIIKVKKQADKVVWFDFLDICGIPRSQQDYLLLVTQFHTVLVSYLPTIKPSEHDLARSFIRFVDVLYDAKVRLIINAAQPIDEIYPEGLLSFEFTRTKSRLHQYSVNPSET